MSSITEFERTKPRETMKKINEIIYSLESLKFIVTTKEQLTHVSSLHKDMLSLKDSFLKGE